MASSSKREPLVGELLGDGRFLGYLDSSGMSEIEKISQIQVCLLTGEIYGYLLAYGIAEVHFIFADSVRDHGQQAGLATSTCRSKIEFNYMGMYLKLPVENQIPFDTFQDCGVYTVQVGDPGCTLIKRLTPDYVPKLIVKIYPSGRDGVLEAKADTLASTFPGSPRVGGNGGSGPEAMARNTDTRDMPMEPGAASLAPRVSVDKDGIRIASPLSANDPALSEDVKRALKKAAKNKMPTADLKLILDHFRTYENIQWPITAARKPKAGGVYLFDQDVCGKDFRSDGHEWKKEPDGTVKEVNSQSLIRGQKVVNGYFVDSEDGTLNRRCYRLNDRSSKIVMVQYLDSDSAQRRVKRKSRDKTAPCREIDSGTESDSEPEEEVIRPEHPNAQAEKRAMRAQQREEQQKAVIDKGKRRLQKRRRAVPSEEVPRNASESQQGVEKTTSCAPSGSAPSNDASVEAKELAARKKFASASYTRAPSHPRQPRAQSAAQPQPSTQPKAPSGTRVVNPRKPANPANLHDLVDPPTGWKRQRTDDDGEFDDEIRRALEESLQALEVGVSSVYKKKRKSELKQLEVLQVQLQTEKDRADAAEARNRELEVAAQDQERLNTELDEARATTARDKAANLQLKKQLEKARAEIEVQKAAEAKAQEEIKTLNEAVKAEKHARAEQAKRMMEAAEKSMKENMFKAIEEAAAAALGGQPKPMAE